MRGVGRRRCGRIGVTVGVVVLGGVGVTVTAGPVGVLVGVTVRVFVRVGVRVAVRVELGVGVAAPAWRMR